MNQPNIDNEATPVDDTEGNAVKFRPRSATEVDDTEGSAAKWKGFVADEDDTEGNAIRFKG